MKTANLIGWEVVIGGILGVGPGGIAPDGRTPRSDGVAMLDDDLQ